jgi:SAM-dependent methyltransferase
LQDVSGKDLLGRVPTIKWNLHMWDDPEHWIDHGDEWTFHATASDAGYSEWKHSVVTSFIDPYIGPEIDVLELGPGHGRWTDYLVGRTRSLTLVDLSPTCIKICEERFSESGAELHFIVNDGSSLPVSDETVDLIWSFGTLVHVEEREIDAYLAEFSRVLRPGGHFFVHHAGWMTGTPALVPISRHLGKPGRVLTRRVSQGQWRGTLDRSAISAHRFRTLAARHGLQVDRQIRRWGDNQQFGLAARDVLSLGSRPAPAGRTSP